MDARKTWSPAPPNELCESYGLDAGGAELGMEAITRNARHWSEATNVGFAQNSHWCATVGPRSFRARSGEPSLAGLFGSAAGHSCVLRLIAKGSSGGARLHVIKHGGFERGRSTLALLETPTPLETLCALVLEQCS
jgi:hypothetical protein